MKKVTEYIEANRRFIICEAEGTFWAFEDKDIDAAGRLTKQINGIAGHTADSVSETIKKVSIQIKVDALVAAGMEPTAAVLKVVCGL